jgi:septal ring factor EnvC (AmiA/AmiB activator)
MRMRGVPYLIVFLLMGIQLGTPQTQEEINRRQNELKEIRDQIRDLESKSKQQQANENEVLELLDTYDQKSGLLRKLLRRLHGEARNIQTRIQTTQSTYEELEQQLAFLKDHYAKYVAAVYKAGRASDIDLLLSSGSLNQLLVRNEYLQRFSEQRRRDAKRIVTKRNELGESQARLSRELSEERRLIAEKGAEEDRLASLSAERRLRLEVIRRNKTVLQKQLQRQIEAAKQMEGLITKLVEADRIKKERATTDSRIQKLPTPSTAEGSFERKKGHLRWPVDEGRIVARFGPQKHPTLKTITQNTGIDIAVRQGTTVSAVAPGDVAIISWLPAYGNVIILSHPNGFRTVYSHLGEIEVAEGQSVLEGDPIGKSGESLDGPRLHFELWKDRDKQNPESWLSSP